MPYTRAIQINRNARLSVSVCVVVVLHTYGAG